MHICALWFTLFPHQQPDAVSRACVIHSLTSVPTAIAVESAENAKHETVEVIPLRVLLSVPSAVHNLTSLSEDPVANVVESRENAHVKISAE